MRGYFAVAVVAGFVAAVLTPQSAAAGSRTAYLLKNSRVVAPGKYRIGKRRMNCGKARTVIAPKFPDYGGALPGMIILNPAKLRRVSLTIRRFIFAHECGHQVVGRDETAADRYAILRGRKEGWLSRSGVRQVCRVLFRGQRGDRYHPPGKVRCRAIDLVFSEPVPARGAIRARSFASDTLNAR